MDITADGRVLRLCTLILNPNSPNITDSEFGFDLVTKIPNTSAGSGVVSLSSRISDYYIDTIDDESPAARSGLRPGDRLVEVDGHDVQVLTFEQVVHLINEAKRRCKLKLLVYPSAILNYGNPDVVRPAMHNQPNSPPPPPPAVVHHHMTSMQAVDSRSMPDLTATAASAAQPYQSQQQYYGYVAQPLTQTYNGASANKAYYKQQKRFMFNSLHAVMENRLIWVRGIGNKF